MLSVLSFLSVIREQLSNTKHAVILLAARCGGAITGSMHHVHPDLGGDHGSMTSLPILHAASWFMRAMRRPTATSTEAEPGLQVHATGLQSPSIVPTRAPLLSRFALSRCTEARTLARPRT